jgi:hypothetical protein
MSAKEPELFVHLPEGDNRSAVDVSRSLVGLHVAASCDASTPEKIRIAFNAKSARSIQFVRSALQQLHVIPEFDLDAFVPEY